MLLISILPHYLSTGSYTFNVCHVSVFAFYHFQILFCLLTKNNGILLFWIFHFILRTQSEGLGLQFLEAEIILILKMVKHPSLSLTSSLVGQQMDYFSTYCMKQWYGRPFMARHKGSLHVCKENRMGRKEGSVIPSVGALAFKVKLDNVKCPLLKCAMLLSFAEKTTEWLWLMGHLWKMCRMLLLYSSYGKVGKWLS